MSNYRYELGGIIRDLKCDIPYPTDDIVDLLDEKDQRIKELEEVTQQLKQQLHDLPKKIVGEIKKELYDCGKTYLEDEPYIEICIVRGILDTILEKYGEEDESK